MMTLCYLVAAYFTNGSHCAQPDNGEYRGFWGFLSMFALVACLTGDICITVLLVGLALGRWQL